MSLTVALRESRERSQIWTADQQWGLVDEGNEGTDTEVPSDSLSLSALYNIKYDHLQLQQQLHEFV